MHRLRREKKHTGSLAATLAKRHTEFSSDVSSKGSELFLACLELGAGQIIKGNSRRFTLEPLQSRARIALPTKMSPAKSPDAGSNFDSTLRLAKRTIDQFDAAKFYKSAQLAEQFKASGNSLIKSGKPREALDAYNEAILRCPVSSESQSLIVANRALALTQLNRQEDALEDVQLALDLGYPERNRSKLLKRRETCLVALEADGQRRNRERGPPNNRTLSLSCGEVVGPIEVFRCESKGGGRGVRSTSRIEVGQLLLAEGAFAAIVLPDQLDRLCYACLKIIGNFRPFPCRKCVQVRYCGRDCEGKAWKEHHSLECGYLELLDAMDAGIYSPKLVLKMVTREGGLEKLLQDIPRQVHGKLTFGSDYNGFVELAEHAQDETDFTKIATFIVAFLQRSSSILEKMSRHDLMKARDTVIQHIRRFQVNSMHVHERFMSSGETDADKASDLTLLEERKTGCGLFLALAMTNHSCSPNAKAAFFDGKIVHMLAIKDIEEGEEVTISYGMFHKWHTLSERQQKLSETYFFDCRCAACEERLQPTVGAYKCSKCSGPVLALDDQVLSCLSCKATSPLDKNFVAKELEAAGRLVSIGMQCLSDHQANKLIVAEKMLRDGHSKLLNVLYKNNTQIAIVLDMLSACNKKLSHFEEAIDFGKKYLELTKSDFDEDVYLFNSLLKLIDCYKLFFEAKDAKKVVETDIRRDEAQLYLNELETQLSRLVPSSSDVVAFYKSRCDEVRRIMKD